MTRRDYFVSNTDAYSDYHPQYFDDSPSKTLDKKYCVKCEKYGFPYQPLSVRIYKQEELINGQIPHDSDNWLQCYRCGTIIHVAHGKAEGTLTGFTDVAGQGDSLDPMIEPFIKPRTPQKRTDNKKKQKKDIHKDPDVVRLLSDPGSQLAGYSDSSD